MKLRYCLALAAALLVGALSVEGFALGSLGGSAFPLTFLTQPVNNPTDGFNQLLAIINAQTAPMSQTYTAAAQEPIGGMDTSQALFSTTLQQNPLVLTNYSDSFVSTIGLYSTGYTTILASQSGRTVYPQGGITIMVSGSAATATALALECSDGTLIASWPIADLVDVKPIGLGLYLSTQGTITTGAGLAKGCGSGKAVYLSNVGAQITTTTHVYVNFPYTVQ